MRKNAKFQLVVQSIDPVTKLPSMFLDKIIDMPTPIYFRKNRKK